MFFEIPDRVSHDRRVKLDVKSLPVSHDRCVKLVPEARPISHDRCVKLVSEAIQFHTTVM